MQAIRPYRSNVQRMHANMAKMLPRSKILLPIQTSANVILAAETTCRRGIANTRAQIIEFCGLYPADTLHTCNNSRNVLVALV